MESMAVEMYIQKWPIQSFGLKNFSNQLLAKVFFFLVFAASVSLSLFILICSFENRTKLEDYVLSVCALEEVKPGCAVCVAINE